MSDKTKIPIVEAALGLQFRCNDCGEVTYVHKRLLNFLIDKKLPGTNFKCLGCKSKDCYTIDWDDSVVFLLRKDD